MNETPTLFNACNIEPSSKRFVVVVATDHKTLKIGDSVVMAQTHRLENVLIRVGDMTLHDPCDDWGQYVTLAEEVSAPMKSTQIGRIEIDVEIVKNTPGQVADVFGKMRFVPVRAEMMFYSMKIEYLGISPMFEEREARDVGSAAPAYDVLFSSDGDVKVEKRGN